MKQTSRKWLSKASMLTGLLAMMAVAYLAEAQSSEKRLSQVVQGSQAASMDACVRETPDMRRNHMDYLKHKRDLTMHKGIRTDDLSLNKCVACHAGKDTAGEFVPVNAEGQFCQSCHERVSAAPDCFQCHRTTPDPRDAQPGLNMSSVNSAAN